MVALALPHTVATAEEAWLRAILLGSEEQRELMLDDCVVVHGPVGFIHGREVFLEYNSTMGAIVEAEASDVHVVEHPGVAIVSCHQKMRVEMATGRTPFLIQAGVTRVWFRSADGLKLGFQQLSRRQPVI
ncbi:nuclear transport factor 2 family protein [Rhodococcus fascians]|nr:nuclear transport factor 2 family protein [Rhodococcus fascians]MBY4114557.1 nuclear transport factor 2 family protein [Rhodococcus fascians]